MDISRPVQKEKNLSEQKKRPRDYPHKRWPDSLLKYERDRKQGNTQWVPFYDYVVVKQLQNKLGASLIPNG